MDYKKELREAIVACDRVIGRLDSAKDAINSAQGLGLLDLIGGKFFMTFFKRRQISKAENEIVKARKDIENLNAELADLKAYVDIDFETGGLLGFLDYFFGGPIADFLVLSKLGAAKKKISDAKTRVLEIKIDLENLLAKELAR